MNRYCRQIQFPPFGETGQRTLARATVSIIGCGGLGTQQAETLVRMGVGAIRLADFDLVTEHNLHRQHLFLQSDCGQPKVLAAARHLREINPACQIETVQERIEDIGAFAGGSSAVLDATDSVPTRFALNDWCIRNRVPYVYGGVAGAEGMVLPVAPQANSPCLRCLYPQPPAESLGVATSGIWPPLVSQIATLQVTLLVKLLMGDQSILGRLYLFNAWEMTLKTIRLEPRPGCSHGN